MKKDLALARSELSLVKDDVRVIDLCMEIVLVTDGPIANVMEGYQRIYDAFMARFGHGISLCQTYDEVGMRPFAPTEWEDISHWLRPTFETAGGSFGAHFQAGLPEQCATPPMFDALHLAPSRELARSGLRIAIPLDAWQSSADELTHWFRALVDDLPFTYGFCGYAFSWNAEYNDVARDFKQWAAPKLLRHPGLGHGDFAPFVMHAKAGLLAVNWITAVGREGVGRVGGAAALVAALPEECKVTATGGGAVLIQAGQEPATGDVNRNDRLPLYAEVARVLRPLWCDDEYLSKINLIYLDAETGARWLRRFLE